MKVPLSYQSGSNRNTSFARPFLQSGSRLKNNIQGPPLEPEAPLGDEFDDDTGLLFGEYHGFSPLSPARKNKVSSDVEILPGAPCAVLNL